jgi:hypothetical protein
MAACWPAQPQLLDSPFCFWADSKRSRDHLTRPAQEVQEQQVGLLRNDFSSRGRVQSAGSILLHPMQATRIRIGSAGLLVKAGAGSLAPATAHRVIVSERTESDHDRPGTLFIRVYGGHLRDSRTRACDELEQKH